MSPSTPANMRHKNLQNHQKKVNKNALAKNTGGCLFQGKMFKMWQVFMVIVNAGLMCGWVVGSNEV